MPLMSLAIPPGVVKNGTNLQQANTWNDANLVRWYEGSMQPVGGWRLRTTSAMAGACRALITYRDNAGDRRTAAGTSSKLYAIDEANALFDITPAGFTAGAADAVQNLGWGALTWGASQWGTSRPDTGPYSAATTWSLDTWGQYLLGCSTSDGKIYVWLNNTANVATVISQAPTGNNAIITTDERFVFALGAGGEGNRVEWCDQEDYTTWTASATNQAGGFTLATGGNIVAARSLRGETLILTNVDAHVARYQGPPYVYGFQRVGTGCGVASANACVRADNIAVWMGMNSFHIYDGGVKALPSSVGDFVFNDINVSQRSKVFGVLNSKFSEVWWFYPSSDATENDRYVAWNYRENYWTIGAIDRTAGADVGEFIYPNFVSSTGYIYEQEVGYSYDSSEVFAESGPVQLGNGDRLMVARTLIPDEQTQGDVTATFKTRLYPNAVESSYGPYQMANPTSVRFQGREVSMRVTGNVATDWRVGIMRLDVVPGSAR
jgi:hypothetical protein